MTSRTAPGRPSDDHGPYAAGRAPDRSCARSHDRRLHVVLGTSGGSGAAFVAAFLAQYLQARRVPVLAYSLSSPCATLRRYHALDVQILNVTVDGHWSFARSMDALLEVACDAEGAVVASLGTSGLLGFAPYGAEDVLAPVLAGAGVGLVLHVVAPTRGDVSADALALLGRATGLPADTPAVIWRNPGVRAGVGDDDRSTPDALAAVVAALLPHWKVAGTVRVPALTPARYGLSLERLSRDGLTFGELLAPGAADRATQHRLLAVWHDLVGQIARALDDGPVTG